MTVIVSNPVAIGTYSNGFSLVSDFSTVNGINDQDQVIGTATLGGGVVWQDGQITTLGEVSGDSSAQVLGLNDEGQIVGASNSATANHPVLWQNGALTQLSLLGPSYNARAFGINDQGVIVGSTRTSADLDQAFSEQNGTTTLLGNLAGGGAYNAAMLNSRAMAINDSDQIVGYGLATGSVYHAILWQNGIVVDLGTLTGGTTSQANAINKAGAIVGFSTDANGVDQAVIWQNGTIQELPDLQSTGVSIAYGVNDAGIVVGRSDIYTTSAGWTEHAVMWQNGVLIDLNNYVPANSGWVLNVAEGINDNGEIAGIGSYNGLTTAFVMSVGDSGTPSMSVASALQSFAATPHGSAVSVMDTGAAIDANFDALETLAGDGKLLRLQFSDAAAPTLTLSDTQMEQDANVFNALSGNYSLHLTGLSVATAQYQLSQPHVTAVGITDASYAVSDNLDLLQSWASAGQLVTITLTDSDPILYLDADQLQSDAQALAAIQSPYQIGLSELTVSQALTDASTPHLGYLGVTDTAAHIAAAITQLQALPVTLQLTVVDSSADISANFTALFWNDSFNNPITFDFTDSGTPVINITDTQEEFGQPFLATLKPQGQQFEIVVNVTQLNETVSGLGLLHPTVISFPGASSDYTVTSADTLPILSAFYVSGTENGQATKDYVTETTALQFSDGTYFVAQTPVAGEVNSGTVTELYAAVLARKPDLAGLQFYEAYFAGGSTTTPVTTVAQWFLQSAEYQNNPAHDYTQSAAGDAQFITDTYENLLDRAPDTGAVAYYQKVVAQFTAGLTPDSTAYAAAQLAGHAQVLAYFAASQEFLNDVEVTSQHPADAQHWLYLI